MLELIAFGALTGTAISAAIGTCSPFVTHVHPWSNCGLAWLMWWLGDAMGVLIVTPLIMTFTRLFTICQNRRLLELVGLLFGALLTCFLIFKSGWDTAAKMCWHSAFFPS